MKENPSSDEKVLAALAHASVLFSFFGPVGPTIIWVSQRKKSRYVTFHALQAMGYQASLFWLWFIGAFFIFFAAIILAAILSALSINTSSELPFFPFIIQPIAFLGIFGLWGIFFLTGIGGAMLCMIGHDFNYPLFGKWLRKKLFAKTGSDEEINEKWEENWVSGVCHSTAILQMWGVITPLIIWYTQKERSIRLRFQSLQAVFYQLIATIAYFLSFGVYMAMYFLLIISVLGLGVMDAELASNEGLSSIAGIIFMVMILGMMLMALISMVAAPLYFLLAAIASVFTIGGRDFRYPILGQVVSRRIQNAGSAEVLSP